MATFTSEVGVDLIKSFESFCPYLYRCPAGALTVGYGTVVKSPSSVVQPISKDAACALLAASLAPIDAWLHETFPSAPQNCHDALACFAYNVGLQALRGSTLVVKLKAGDVAGAADELLRWDKVGTKPMAGLARRRAAERALFLTKATA